MFKNIKTYLYLTIIAAVAVLLILNKFLLYGIVVAATGILGYILWQQIIKAKDTEIAKLNVKLKQNNQDLTQIKEEVEELRNRKLKISDIKNILDLGLMEINTNFTRTWNKQFTHNKQEVHFIGALRINIIAKFGIDLKELRFKYNPQLNEIIVANANPKFLSFTDLDYIWEISEILEYKKPFVGINHWKKSEKLEMLGHNIKQDLQNQIHYEVKNGPEELEWVLNPLRKQIKNTLYILLGGNDKKILIADQYDDSFMLIDQLPETILRADKNDNIKAIET